ncbi:BZ3500_MvSof-1268-A1-R1_Chr6-2g08480 [Microbotryum saponariae]|uniref:BZ3500_MvSof-1268-A1-R1_Chr6-2g08480 protein n=1 Tax=Microbotryum saponariae TaxID=289078 RepID=A0A2X0NPM5_9BASI|nr:BZ3500_MvSof-1268-A1-R1_Chr6-2g08480 [Microbotryum saponariae]SDA07757.1 BZ3501_MvSof-1269-A2-R1_Chr6-1g08194 [Microbotryum saponariae]
MSHAEASALLNRATSASTVDDELGTDQTLDQLTALIKLQPALIPVGVLLHCRTTSTSHSHATILSQGIWPAVLRSVTDPRSTRLFNWATQVVRYALTLNVLAVDTRINRAFLVSLLALPAIKTTMTYARDTSIQKIGLQCFASIYPLLFKYACSGNDQQTWMTVNGLKMITLEMWRDTQKGKTGGKVAAVKVLQRIIQTQTKATSDPRLQRTVQEPNLLMCNPNHAFLKPVQLEDEANKLFEEAITTLFTSDDSDLVSALVSTLTVLVKSRTSFARLVVTALTHWVPTALVGKVTPTQIRSTEKIVRTSLTHLLKTNTIAPFASQVTDFLQRQAVRMDAAALEARQQQEKLLLEQARKRQLQETEASIAAATKRRRTDSPNAEAGPSTSTTALINLREVFTTTDGTPNALAQFDASILPLNVCIDFLVATMQQVDAAVLARGIEAAKARLSQASAVASTSTLPTEEVETKDGARVIGKGRARYEVYDPLKIDLGDDELVLKTDEPETTVPTRTKDEIRASRDEGSDDEDEGDDEDEDDRALPVVEFDSALTSTTMKELMTSSEMTPLEKDEYLVRGVRRLCQIGAEGGDELWISLVARLVTRGIGEEEGEGGGALGDRMREEMLEFVKEDPRNRMEFARKWLNEEWFAEKMAMRTKEGRKERGEGHKERTYDIWLRKLLAHIMSKSSNRDRGFTQFVIDLPDLPVDEVEKLGQMCMKKEQVQLGFSALRELAVLRPPFRPAAVDVLLSLTTHKDKPTRNAAINTVKKWVPDSAALSPTIIDFALSLISRMEVAPLTKSEESKKEDGAEDGEVDMAMEVTPPPEEQKPVFAYALVKDARVVDRLDPPESREDVVRHVELLFALCHKHPHLLKQLFTAFATLQPMAQEHILSLITPLIKSLGITNPELLKAIDLAPEGSDALLLRVLNLLGEKLPRLPSGIIQSLKKIAKERVLDPQFYVMIVSECDKDELKAYIPRIISLLDCTPERKALIRSVFLAATAPPSEKGAMASRSKIKLLTAVELMSVLHQSDAISGIKPAIEAISICFSMTDAFRPEILSSFMQYTLDSFSTIPTLFLRTVIQAVSTYKSALSPFISSTLLVKLINKQVWQSPPVWEGFIRLAKVVQPGSFKALLLLPREQLEDVVRRQAGLKEGLREVVQSGMGPVGEAGKEIMEILGEPKEETVQQQGLEESIAVQVQS